MDSLPAAASIIGFIGLGASFIGAWMSLRERLVRAETRVENLEKNQSEHKTEVGQLREWLDTQFIELRKTLERKADR